MSRRAVSREELDELSALATMPDDKIDTGDIPEAPAANWNHIQRASGQSVAISVDAEIVSWFKQAAGGSGYQTEIDRVLRQHIAKTTT